MTLNTHDWWESNEPHLGTINFLVIHETDGPADQTVEEIDAYHKQHNGWAGVGYHRLIAKDGTIHEGRPDDVLGAQAKDLNAVSLGQAYIGTFTDSLPPEAQYNAGVHCAAVLCLRHNIPVKNIIGHRDVSVMMKDPSVATDCPGEAIYCDLPNFRARVVQEMDRIEGAS